MDRNEEISPDVRDIMRQLNVDGDDEEVADAGITDALNELLGSNVANDDIVRLLEQINGMHNEGMQAATHMESISTTDNDVANVKMEPSLSMPFGSSLNEASNIATPSTSANPPNKESEASAMKIANTPTARIAVSPSTQFDSIISELNVKDQGRMQELLSMLQSDRIGIDKFMVECKKILNTRQYQELERIRGEVRKNLESTKPSPAPSASSSRRGSPGATPTNVQSPMPSTNRPNTIVKPKKHAGDTSTAMTVNIIPYIVPPPPTLQQSQLQPQPLPSSSSAASSSALSANARRAGNVHSTKDIILPSPIQASTANNQNGATPNVSLSRSRTTTEPVTGSAPSTNDKLDVDALTDVMGYVGVDLREESENILRSGIQQLGATGGGSLIDRSHTQNFINIDCLRLKIERIANRTGIRRPNNDVLNYLALATQQRLQGLVQEMVAASKHRAFSQMMADPPLDSETNEPLYSIALHQDVKRQLSAIERIERKQEEKRKNKMKKTNDEEGNDGTGGTTDGSKSAAKRRTKKTKAMSERNLSEDVRKRITNETAMRSAGGKMKSWMLAGLETNSKPSANLADNANGPGKFAKSGSITPLHRLKSGAAGASTSKTPINQLGGSLSGSKNISNPYIMSGGNTTGSATTTKTPILQKLPYGARRVTVKDALYCLEQERLARGIGRRSLLKSLAQRLN
ncbi:transcription initiation factor TFIID component TAF4 family-domain-containing protein [Syncephalis plumigaleata]|nr:transcription initiation factor TFIID component TAF4 family-domain-containing protein [Syncephalis plumigaleata]